MKKYLIGSLLLIGALSMVGCNSKKDDKVIQEYNGIVKEIRDGEFDLEYSTQEGTDLIIVISDEKVNEGDNVVVKTEGMVMLSEPARVNAIDVTIENDESVILNDFEVVDILDEEYILIRKNSSDDSRPVEYKVNYSGLDVLPEVKVSDRVNVKYDGNMTKSIPPIINALNIELVYED